MMPDLAVELLMPPLMEKITKLAPNVRIDVVPWRGPAIFTAEFARTIDHGDLDRQRLHRISPATALHRQRRARGAARPPVGARLKRPRRFLDARHVAVVIRGQSEDLIDIWLRPKGIERRIALVVPGYIEALHVTARTDLVAFVPRRLIGALSKQLSLATITPPLDPGIDEQFMFYPTRAQMDPGSIWLRNIMLGIGREMERGEAEGCVGWAKARMRRAHHPSTNAAAHGGHASLCPPYKLRTRYSSAFSSASTFCTAGRSDIRLR